MPAARARSGSLVCLVRMNDEIPRACFDLSVTAVTTKISPTPPCVMNRFAPLST